MYLSLVEFWKWAIVDGMAHYLSCVTIGFAVVIVLSLVALLVKAVGDWISRPRKPASKGMIQRR